MTNQSGTSRRRAAAIAASVSIAIAGDRLGRLR